MELFQWAYLGSSILMVLAYERFMSAFYDERKTSSFIWAGSYVLCYLVTALIFLLFNVPILSLSVTLLALFLIAFNYESTFRKQMAVVATVFVFGNLSELLTVIFLEFYQVNLTESIGFDNSIAFVIAHATFYVKAVVFRNFKKLKSSTLKLPFIFWITFLIIPVASVLVLLFGFAYFPQTVALITTILVLGIDVLTFYLLNSLSVTYEEKIESQFEAQEKEYYFSQNELMVKTVEVVKSIRHDMKLHFVTLDRYVTDNPEARTYIKRLINDIETSEVYSDTGNTAIDSIVNFKLKSAKVDGIDVGLKIFVPAAIGIEPPDIVTIVGNLLDNALDAVSKVEEKKINLYITYQTGNLFIRVDNTFDGVLKQDKKQGGLATRKSGEGGYGLKNVAKSVERYDGSLEMGHEGHVFTVKVLLYGGIEK